MEMHQGPTESDWKSFSKMVPELRERYLVSKNQALIQILSDPTMTPTEQFWTAHERMQKESRILQNCLDGHARSRQLNAMVLMCEHGMLKASDLDDFSEGLADHLRRYLR
jgi:hypothetical protein